MAFDTEVIYQFNKLNPEEDRPQRILSIMRYGKNVQLVKQEYWFDDATQQHKPGKLKGLSIADLQKLDAIGLNKIIGRMKKYSKT